MANPAKTVSNEEGDDEQLRARQDQPEHEERAAEDEPRNVQATARRVLMLREVEGIEIAETTVLS
jgi:hypothetical protein